MSAQWQGEAGQLHVGTCGPCGALPGMQSSEGGPGGWGHIPPGGRQCCLCLSWLIAPSQEGTESWDEDWVLGGDLCWEVAEVWGRGGDALGG